VGNKKKQGWKIKLGMVILTNSTKGLNPVRIRLLRFPKGIWERNVFQNFKKKKVPLLRPLFPWNF